PLGGPDRPGYSASLLHPPGRARLPQPRNDSGDLAVTLRRRAVRLPLVVRATRRLARTADLPLPHRCWRDHLCGPGAPDPGASRGRCRRARTEDGVRPPPGLRDRAGAIIIPPRLHGRRGEFWRLLRVTNVLNRSGSPAGASP